jgi:hypothetical protein
MSPSTALQMKPRRSDFYKRPLASFKPYSTKDTIQPSYLFEGQAARDELYIDVVK